jgi:hypothetical protein
MSMIGNYLKLAPEQLEAIITEPSEAEGLAYPESGDYPPNALDIDKSWHLIHFLLNGETWGGAAPLMNVVLGGSERPDTDAGYGPFRYLEPAEVQTTSQALSGISSEDLWARFDAKEVEAAEIYPTLWKGDDGDREYVLRNFESLQKYFSEAAASGNALLLYLS